MNWLFVVSTSLEESCRCHRRFYSRDLIDDPSAAGCTATTAGLGYVAHAAAFAVLCLEKHRWLTTDTVGEMFVAARGLFLWLVVIADGTTTSGTSPGSSTRRRLLGHPPNYKTHDVSGTTGSSPTADQRRGLAQPAHARRGPPPGHRWSGRSVHVLVDRGPRGSGWRGRC
jgi:hypothetical protein